MQTGMVTWRRNLMKYVPRVVLAGRVSLVCGWLHQNFCAHLIRLYT
jgi:hypothetical protein